MPGIMDGTSRALVAEVDYATKQGTELLQQGEREKALGLFQVFLHCISFILNPLYVENIM